jgi:hypothetical protein
LEGESTLLHPPLEPASEVKGVGKSEDQSNALDQTNEKTNIPESADRTDDGNNNRENQTLMDVVDVKYPETNLLNVI